jgi:atrial natriuretic peptide receptor B
MRPQDILLQSFDSNAPTVAVIAGFGLSRRHLDLQRILHSAKHCNWIAPEVQQGECKAGSTTSDVFSFGMVMWSLLTSQTTPTFSRNGSETPQDAKQAICEGLRPIIPQYDSSAMMEIHWVKLMQRCWSQDPADRLEVNELLAEVKSLAAATTFLQNMYL